MDLAELLVDDVVVVDEPLGGRCDRAVVLDRPSEDPIRLEEHAAVLGDAGLDGATPAGCVGDGLDGGEDLGVLFQPLDAEELLEDRLLQLRLGTSPPALATEGISTGRVRSHRPQSAHGPTRPTIASSWARVDDTASPRRDGWAPASLGGRAGPIRHMFVSSAGTSGTAGAPLPAVVSTSHRASRV